jgi:ubiquinone/menaquinone biosynthesis C-methylase UbiE
MTHPEDANTARSYVLGDSGRELDRLSTQARLLKPITRRWLHEAGIVPGMQVLDVGTGTGDVAFIAADLVGDSGNGAVLGVCQMARQRTDRESGQ